tara:strand:+ start:5362 stop:6309 length:948 start_codon:yes stop_codon:yes gene_type:complete
MFSILEYKKFYNSSLEHIFDDKKGVFISDIKLSKNSIFGFNSSKNLVIIFPSNIYRTNVGIQNVCMLSQPTEYTSVIDNSCKVFGCPLIYFSNSIEEQYEMLMHINDLLESDDYVNQINRFLNVIETFNLGNKKFSSSGFFSEVCVVLNLINNYPSITNHWISTRNEAFDIKSSENNPDIEIKSTLNPDIREHKISINQIQSFKKIKNAEIASVICFKDPSGISCKDICKILLSKLNKNDLGYQRVFNIIISFENIAEFTNDLFDMNKTRKTIRFLKPDFSSLVLEPQPIWLRRGILTIDFDRLNNFGSNVINEY